MNMIRAIGIALILIGIIGLILASCLPCLGLASVPGLLAALLTGIGFLWMCRCCCKRD